MPYTIPEKLTVQRLKDLEPGVFATGTISDNPNGVNMSNSDNLLRWVASRGYAPDWAIYIHRAEYGPGYVKDHGAKVLNYDNIRKLVDCDDDAFAKYRY